jgi:flavin reductase (DIM6/NTAB) family NADH-FMN oxidoreductase RutF
MPSITPDLFRRACGRFPTGVAIITAFDGRPQGVTVNSFTSVSLRPPLVLFCLDRDAQIIEVFRKCTHFAVNVLGEGQHELSSAFASLTGDRFAGVDWQPGLESLPLLRGAVAWLECRLVRVWQAGDHDIFVGEAIAGEVTTGDPLVYLSGYRRLEPTVPASPIQNKPA